MSAADDVLAGLPRPPGSASAVSASGRQHHAAAEQLGASAKTLMNGLQSITTSVWTGPASRSAMGYTAVLAAVCAKAADTADEIAGALSRYGAVLAQAQAQWDQAARLAAQAVADEAAYRSHAEAQAQALEKHAAATANIGAAHVAASIRADAASYQSPLRARAVALATQAVQDAQRAARTAGAQIHQATLTVSPPPPPPTPHHSTPWYDSVWHQVEGFGEGLYHGVADPAKFLFGLVNPLGDPVKNWEQLGNGLVSAAEHPGQFAKALADWKDLSSGQYGRWLGNLAPSVAAAILTGGAAAGIRGAEDVTAADRLAAAADAADTAGGTSWLTKVRLGQDFNKVREGAFDANELRLANGKILDGYTDGESIVSRKYTQLSEISERTAKRYIDELGKKYAPGTRIADTPSVTSRYPELVGEQLDGKPVLEVPIQRTPIPQSILDYARLKGVRISEVPLPAPEPVRIPVLPFSLSGGSGASTGAAPTAGACP